MTPVSERGPNTQDQEQAPRPRDPGPEPRCGRWRLKPFELARPLLLRADGPLTLGEFLANLDPGVVDEFRRLDPVQRQSLVLARIGGAPPERPLALFGRGGYTFADAVREVAEGTPLGVRIIEAECKLVGLLLTEALGFGTRAEPPEGLAVEAADLSTPELARRVSDRLLAAYGEPPPRQGLDPLSELVATILSQHTSDVNTERAFASLLSRFGSFEAVREAPVEQVEAAIRSGGLARVKAPRIKRVLDQIVAARGELSLDFLADLDLPEARRFLTSLDGVGPKTAACVLLFALGKPALPVDTHVHRVSRRLGLIGPRTGADQAHAELEAAVPPDQAYAFHMHLIRHGRQICRAQRPRCAYCPLADLCPRIGL